MKRFLLICLSALLVFLSACRAYGSPILEKSSLSLMRSEEDAAAPAAADAEAEPDSAVEAGDFLCEPNEEGGLTLTAYRGSAPDPEIPAEIDGQPVTAIPLVSFSSMAQLKECCGAFRGDA